MKYFILLSFLFISIGSMSQDSTRMKHLYVQAMELEEKGDIDNAIRVQMSLFRLDTSNYVSANVIAGLFGKKGAFQSEIQWARKAIQINPNFSDAYINLGNGFAGIGNLEMAETSYLQSQKTDSTNCASYYSLGVLKEMKRDLPAAIAYYEKSVQVNPKFADGYFNLAAAYANMKQFAKANQSISKVLEINPQDREAKEMQKQILLELNKNH